MGLFGRSKDAAKGGSGPKVEAEVTLDDGKSYKIDRVIDCIGDSCPRPQLMTKKALADAASGEVIEVRIDNPTSMEAIPPMMPDLQARHLGTVKDKRYWRVIITKN